MIQHDLIGAIRDRVGDGIPYLGTSAGSNVACPSIRTTNDMPILQPPTFDSLGLVPFQINPHYIERDPDVPHGGETRRQRLAEFHEEADMPVVGLPEGSWLTIEDKVVLHGRRPALLFRRGSQPSEIGLGEIPWEHLTNDAPPGRRKL
jgi:dipeptidase E